MEKNEKRTTRFNKRLVSAITLSMAFAAVMLCLISIVGTPQQTQGTTNTPYTHPVPLDDRGITWDVRMNFSETGGKNDYVMFGEAPDANDGPPADSYDVAKPPAPIPPYIRTWLNDNLPTPYDVLWKDYRHYPGVHKVWNLTVQWMPSSGSNPTTVTMAWSKSNINSSEYDKVLLMDSAGVQVANMRTSGSYTFSCPAYVPQAFYINCTVDTKPPQVNNHSPGSGETGDSYTFNASVFDDLTPPSSLMVKVNWTQGSLHGNDTMTYAGGNYFVKTITLDEYSTSALIYHFYAKDTAKVPNVNYTSAYSATVGDNDPPSVTDQTTGPATTGDSLIFSVSATDNIGVSSVYVEYWYSTWTHTNTSMSFVSGTTYQKTITVLSNTTQTLHYMIGARDAALNSKSTGVKDLTVSDNDPPQISNIGANPASQLVSGRVNITANITDNINLLEEKVRISGPAGYTPVNISMTHDGGTAFFYNSTYTIAGLYNYTIWAKDTNSNRVISAVYQFTIFAKLQITTLQAGWNFISVPLNQTVSKIQLIVKYGGTEYYWSKAVANGYVLTTIYEWNRTAQGYGTVEGLAPGQGYWMYAYYGCELWMTNLSTITTSTYITSLKVKWNVVGVPAGVSVNKTALIVRYNNVDYNWTQATTNANPTGGPLILKDIYGWNRNTPQGYLLSNTLDAGYCYWIYAYYQCVLKRAP